MPTLTGPADAGQTVYPVAPSALPWDEFYTLYVQPEWDESDSAAQTYTRIVRSAQIVERDGLMGPNTRDIAERLPDEGSLRIALVRSLGAHGYFVCSACSEMYNAANVDNSTVFVRGPRGPIVASVWCAGCAEDAVYNCSSDELYSQEAAEHFLYQHEDGSWYASPPESEEDEDESYDDGEPVFSYGTNVLSIHGWPAVTPANSLCFGVELEAEPKRGQRQSGLVAALGGRRGNGRYILKSDGSLDSGAELVTLPYSLEYHQSEFGWHRILGGDVPSVGRSGAGTSNCGIHVHVNRAALSPLTIGKALVFLNCADNVGLVTAIAQRASNGYASRDQRKKLTDIHCGNRYDLLNVSGSKTIEFRLFRGNLRPERVLKNIEFCHALLMFCQASGIKASARGSRFLEYVATRTSQYPNLCRFLIEKGIAPAGTGTTASVELAEPVAALTEI